MAKVKKVRSQNIPFQITRDVTNAETMAALKEYEEMKAHPENYKRYSNFDEALKDVLK
ncbi:MAG: hypothetical protein Q4E22_05220 [Coriobacteriia bacterium]|nr:hypothetical protein [Coriobacteriia bacterium]